MTQSNDAKSTPNLSVNFNKDQELGTPWRPLTHSRAFYSATPLEQSMLVSLAITL